MKMIKITTDNQISVHDFPERSFEEQNKSLRDYIGPKCELFERVMPKRLYNELRGSRERGNCVSMLVDEDGHYKEILERDAAKAPIKDTNSGVRYTDDYICPNCGKRFIGTGIAEFCYHCGQRLKWED